MKWWRTARMAAMVGCLASGACVDLSALVDNADGGGITVTIVPDDMVLVVFINASDSDAVDVEFHATTEPLADLPDDLFVDDYAIHSGIGVAGTGILTPSAIDTIELDCTDDLSLGTAGGAFLDDSSGDETGRGNPRWAQATPLGLCGSIVTFTFSSSGFETTVSINRGSNYSN